MKRKIAAGVLMAGICIGVAACGQPQTETVTASVETAAETEESAAETETESETESMTMPAGTEENARLEIADGTYDGIVIDAAMNTLVIDTPEGEVMQFTMPEDRNCVETQNGILLGGAVAVTVQDGEVTAVKDSSMQPKASADVLGFAADLYYVFEYQDIQTMAKFVSYPITIAEENGDVTIESEEDFLQYDPQLLFQEDRKEAILSTNLFELEAGEDGTYRIGNEEHGVTFQEKEGDIWAQVITDID